MSDKYKVLALSNAGFYFSKLDSKQIEQILQELGNHNLQSRVTVLKYVSNS